MNLFVFGLGYSALHFVRTRRECFQSIAGTAREWAKADKLAAEGLTVRLFDDAGGDDTIATDLFDDAGGDDTIATDLRGVEALLISVPPGEHDPVLARWADAIAAAPRLRTIVYLSTVGVYGDAAGGWVDESTDLNPNSGRNRERVEAESAWTALGARRSTPVHLLRLGGIYGPGRSAIDNLRNGTARRLVKPGQVFNRIHVEDIARAVEAAFHHHGGGAWNVTDDLPAPPQDVIAFAAHLIGVEPPPEIPFETANLSPMARSFYGSNKRVDNTRLKRDLGVRLAYPTYRDGLAALARTDDPGAQAARRS